MRLDSCASAVGQMPLICPDTPTSHSAVEPAPGAVKHVTCVFVTVTLQPTALYTAPDVTSSGLSSGMTPGPYTTKSNTVPTGPRFWPVSTTTSPPAVLAFAAPGPDTWDRHGGA